MLDTIELQEQIERGDNYAQTASRRMWRMWGSIVLLLLAGFFLPSMLNLNLDSLGAIGHFLPFALAYTPIYYYGRQNGKDIQARAAMVRKRLPDLLPEMQEYVPLFQPKAQKGLSGEAIFSWLTLLLSIGLFFYFLGTGNGIASAVIITIGFLLWILGKPLLRLFDPSIDAENRAYLLRLIGGILFFLLVVFVPVFFLQQWFGTWLLQLFQLRFHQGVILLFALSMPLIWFMFYLYALAPHYYITMPAIRGDFETSLQRGTSLSRFMGKQVNVMSAYGWVLLLAGRWDEAETLWRAYLQENQNGGVGVVANALLNLAAALSGQGRHDEAKIFLEAAVKIRPESAVGYRELAQWYLENHEAAQRALELSEAAMHFAKKPRLTFAGFSYSWGATLATHAFALAANGKQTEAFPYLERAFTEIDQNDKYAQSFLKLYAGHIYAALGNSQKAREYYAEVIALHPSYGLHSFAEKALQELDAALT